MNRITLASRAAAALVLLLSLTATGRAQNAAGESRQAPASDGFLMPEAVASFGAAMLGDELFVVGGHVGEKHVHSRANLASQVRRRNVASGSEWVTEEGPALQGLAVVAARGALVRIGGLTARNAPGEKEDLWSVADVARRTGGRAEWEEMPPLPAPRSSHDAAVIGDRIFVAGGWTLAGGK